jgi:lipopolysaccharide/colanic/teichoic acid biosynthesis glycosyltransferase
MRRLSIDEFPQLINVLRGEMSLVGPRPPLPAEVVQYTPHDWRRLEVPPGMTGLWQVSGRSSLTFSEMVRLDLFYIENWSVPLDISLMLRTVPAVLFAKGAY